MFLCILFSVLFYYSTYIILLYIISVVAALRRREVCLFVCLVFNGTFMQHIQFISCRDSFKHAAQCPVARPLSLSALSYKHTDPQS